MRIELHDIHKRFGETEVLGGVDLAVESGEVLALVGENGAGKSTLTRIVSGAHPPDGGHITIDGEEVVLATPQDAMARGIQVIYQEFRHNISRTCRWPRTCSPSTSTPSSAASW